MDRIVPISEGRASLSELVTETSDHPVYLLRHGKPVADLLDADKYERLLDHIEDLEDTLACSGHAPTRRRRDPLPG